MGTDGVEPLGISLPAQARGGADVAVGDSALSQIDNPATLTLSRNAGRLDFAGQLLMPRAHWSGPIDSADSTIRHIPLGHVGLVIPKNERLALGLAVHSKSQLAARYEMRHLLLPQSKRRVGADMRDLAVSVNLGCRSTEKLSIGAGLRGELATTRFNTVSGPAVLDFSRGYALGAGFQLGLYYQALPTLGLGVGYRSPTWFQELTGGGNQTALAGGARASLFGLRPVKLGRGTVEDIRLPQRISAGAAWDAADWLKLVGEVRWINYSNSVFHSSHFAFDGRMGLSIESPLGYRDQWVFIAGAEFKLNDHWKLGVGYHYGTNPVSRSAIQPVTSIITQHHVTTGLRYERDNWWLGAVYILGFRNSLGADVRTHIPLGTDYALSAIDQMQHSVTLGFGFSWE